MQRKVVISEVLSWKDVMFGIIFFPVVCLMAKELTVSTTAISYIAGAFLVLLSPVLIISAFQLLIMDTERIVVVRGEYYTKHRKVINQNKVLTLNGSKEIYITVLKYREEVFFLISTCHVEPQTYDPMKKSDGVILTGYSDKFLSALKEKYEVRFEGDYIYKG